MRKISTVFYKENDFLYFTCKKGFRSDRFEALACADAAFEDLIINRNWYLSACGYPCTGGGSNRVFLHHLVLGGKPINGDIVDHINQNKLDARKMNLRFTNKSVNAFNSKIGSKNTSGSKGVSFSKERGKWESYISINGKRVNLGRFDFIGEAIAARKGAEKTLALFHLS